MGNGIWSSRTRNHARRRSGPRVPSGNRQRAYWAGKIFEAPLTHGRKFTKEELWENYTYFIKQVVPVAEEVGVRIGIHPDDPPVPELGGVPRCIFGNFDGYVRALEIANSPNIGVCLCCGTWMEGGKEHGQGRVRSDSRDFAKMGKLWKIHFRNVSAPIPALRRDVRGRRLYRHEEGDADAVDVDFRGILIADHVPQMVGDAAPAGPTASATSKPCTTWPATRRRGSADESGCVARPAWLGRGAVWTELDRDAHGDHYRSFAGEFARRRDRIYQ